MRFLLSLLILTLSLFSMRSHAAEPNQSSSQTPTNAIRIGAAPSGKAQVVFFRDAKFYAFAAFYTVHEGDHSMARLHNGQYFVSVVDPGAHRFEVQTTSGKSDSLDLTVQPGKTYYVLSTVTFGFPIARPHLMSSDAATFDKMAAHLEKVPAK